MKFHAANTGTDATRQPAAAATTRAEAMSSWATPGKAPVQHSALQTEISQSPRMVMQRQRVESLLGGVRQQKARAHQNAIQSRAASSEAQPNRTGLPDQLKSGIESLSGMDMSAVRVHRNSDKPAQLSALAYAQGNSIHLGPGQEQHLPHEAWHVVQQRQGRVTATTNVGGVGVNDDVSLEKEADRMGARAGAEPQTGSPVQRQATATATTQPVFAGVVQRVLGAEDLAAANVPAEHVSRVLEIMNSFDEALIREHLDGICLVFSMVPSWADYTDGEIRAFIDDLVAPAAQGEAQAQAQVQAPPPFVLNPGAMNNPWLHIHMEDFGQAHPRLLVDDATEVDGYIALGQTCSVMSVDWVLHSGKAGHYAIRSAADPAAIAHVIYSNQSADAQFTWAEQATGMHRVNAAPTVEQLRALGVGGRFVLYSEVHVSAGIVRDGGFLYYDPETGSASQITNQEMGIYVATAQRYLHS